MALSIITVFPCLKDTSPNGYVSSLLNVVSHSIIMLLYIIRYCATSEEYRIVLNFLCIECLSRRKKIREGLYALQGILI